MFVGDGFVVHTLSARLALDVPLRFYQFPGFVLHGVLGRKLRQFSCALKRESCEGCPLLSHCAYAFFFISHRPLAKDVLPGRQQMPHPWAIRLGRDFDGQPQVSELEIALVLFGHAVQSAHILLLALQEAGKDGILDGRVPYGVHAVQLNGVDWDGDPVKQDEHVRKGKAWRFQLKDELSKAYRISLLSPLRLKVKGKYADQFQSRDLFRAAQERLSALCSLYGQSETNEAEIFISSQNHIVRQDLKWLDYSRWSSRQRTTMKLGGVVGEIEMRGLSEPRQTCLLKGSELAGLGKNTSFGLGELRVEEVD